jgi:hypothetical protein
MALPYLLFICQHASRYLSKNTGLGLILSRLGSQCVGDFKLFKYTKAIA